MILTIKEELKTVRKMKTLIRNGKVVKNAGHLYEDNKGNVVRSRTDAKHGCVMGLYFMVNKNNDVDFISSFTYRSLMTCKPYGATALTEKGPKAMLKALDRIEKLIIKEINNGKLA